MKGWKGLHGQFEPALTWARGQRDWLWVIPDMQTLADARFANLGKEVEWLILTLRHRKSSVWVDAQRPSWIPRAAGDQSRSVVLFKNTDLDTVDRLRKIISLPSIKLIQPIFGQMAKHDFLWYDGLEEELFYVDGHR